MRARLRVDSLSAAAANSPQSFPEEKAEVITHLAQLLAANGEPLLDWSLKRPVRTTSAPPSPQSHKITPAASSNLDPAASPAPPRAADSARSPARGSSYSRQTPALLAWRRSHTPAPAPGW